MSSPPPLNFSSPSNSAVSHLNRGISAAQLISRSNLFIVFLQMLKHLLLLCLFPVLTLGCFGGASLPGQFPGQVNFDSYAAPPSYKTAPPAAVASPLSAPTITLEAPPPPPAPLFPPPAPLPPPPAPLFPPPAPLPPPPPAPLFPPPAPLPPPPAPLFPPPQLPQLFQSPLKHTQPSSYSIAPPPSYSVSPPSSPSTEATYATPSTVPPTIPQLYSVVPPQYKVEAPQLPAFPTLPPVVFPALPNLSPPPPPEPIFFAGPPPPPPVKVSSYSVGPQPPPPPPPAPSYSVSPYEVPPPAYNPAFKVVNPTNSVELTGNEQQQLSQNQGQMQSADGQQSNRSKQDASQRDEKGTDDARGEAAEKPKQFGVTQQQAQKLDQPSVIGMNPLQMRDHLRTQLKKNRKPWNQP